MRVPRGRCAAGSAAAAARSDLCAGGGGPGARAAVRTRSTGGSFRRRSRTGMRYREMVEKMVHRAKLESRVQRVESVARWVGGRQVAVPQYHIWLYREEAVSPQRSTCCTRRSIRRSDARSGDGCWRGRRRRELVTLQFEVDIQWSTRASWSSGFRKCGTRGTSRTRSCANR